MKQRGKEEVQHYCRECAHVEEVTKFHTLTVDGRKPTLGKCQYYTNGKYCVLLSQKSCSNFKKRV